MLKSIINKLCIYTVVDMSFIKVRTWCSFSWIHGISLRDDGDVSTQCKVDPTEVSARACWLSKCCTNTYKCQMRCLLHVYTYWTWCKLSTACAIKNACRVSAQQDYGNRPIHGNRPVEYIAITHICSIKSVEIMTKGNLEIFCES